MPDRHPPTDADPDLAADLRRYFAITATTDLPAGVRIMSAASLTRAGMSRHPRLQTGRWLAAAGALATAAAVTLVGGYTVLRAVGGHQGNASSAQSFGAGAPGFGAALPTVSHPGFGGDGVVPYPGVDPAALRSAGHTLLRAPGDRATPPISGAAAQATAVASQPGRATGRAPGPPVLALVEDLSGAPLTCYCWVIAVPVGSTSTSTTTPLHAVLVYVDANTGAVDGVHSGAGNP